MSSKTDIHKINNLAQLFQQGFWLEIGHWPDTPVGKRDQFLGMDALGHVLIARAPLETD